MEPRDMSRRKKLLIYLLGFSVAFILFIVFGYLQTAYESGTYLALISFSLAIICVLGQMVSLALLGRLSKQTTKS